MAVSEAKKQANAKWNKSQDNIMIRVNVAVGAEIREAAAAAGQSLTQYILDSVLWRMDNDRLLQGSKKEEQDT